MIGVWQVLRKNAFLLLTVTVVSATVHAFCMKNYKK